MNIFPSYQFHVFWSLIIIWMVTACGEGGPTTYYISSSGDDSRRGTSPETAWRSLDRVGGEMLHPGDSVLFRRGDRFSGFIRVRSSGTARDPIILSSYGGGNLPRLTNPVWDTLRDGNVIRVEGQYIRLEKLHFENGPAHPYSDDNARNGNIYDMGAVNFTASSAHCELRYCEIENYPVGVQSQGRHNRIYQSYFHDCNVVMCPPKWGPIAIFIGGSNNEVSYNFIRNYKGGGSGGFDGGAIEVDRMYFRGFGYGADSIQIHHNVSIENAGFAEPEAREINGGHRHLEIFQNLSYDYKWFIEFLHTSDTRIHHNVSIRTLPHMSDNDGVIRLHGSDYSITRNIFISGRGRQTFRPGDRERIAERDHNLYLSHDGSSEDPVGLAPAGGERILADYAPIGQLFHPDGRIKVPEPGPAGTVQARVPDLESHKLTPFTIHIPR
jgi:hypothetical protein